MDHNQLSKRNASCLPHPDTYMKRDISHCLAIPALQWLLNINKSFLENIFFLKDQLEIHATNECWYSSCSLDFKQQLTILVLTI